MVRGHVPWPAGDKNQMSLNPSDPLLLESLSAAQLVCACAAIRNPAGAYLLVRTPARGWEFPGGVVEAGENLIEGLLREVREESGYEIEVQQLLALTNNLSPPAKLILLFAARAIGGMLRPSAETPEVGWFSPAEAEARIRHPANALRWRLSQASGPGIRYVSYTDTPFRLTCDVNWPV